MIQSRPLLQASQQLLHVLPWTLNLASLLFLVFRTEQAQQMKAGQEGHWVMQETRREAAAKLGPQQQRRSLFPLRAQWPVLRDAQEAVKVKEMGGWGQGWVLGSQG
jgi:hypothetical protein